MSHHPDLTPAVIQGLGWLYLLLTAMNGAWTCQVYRKKASLRSVGAWAIYTSLLFMVAVAHITTFWNGENLATFPFVLPQAVKKFIDLFANPLAYFAGSTLLFIFVLAARKWLASPTVAWVILNGMFLFMCLSMTDYDFRQIVGKPDNVPIVSMLFIVAYFTWLYFRRAVENDERLAAGLPVRESVNNEKVLTWPDLVYTELICMIVFTAILTAWGVALQAPLEEPASAVKTPNPSKAPWYFLGLQEMLVYYDPWMAGVVLPSVIVVGLMALPYIDFNKKGNGYYTYNERKFAVVTFLFGFLPLWIGLIILGTFLRGPNWNFFGIYEPWDAHKLEALNNVNLSERFWLDLMKQPLPVAPAGSPFLVQAGYIFLREWLGITLVLAYLVVLPPLMAMTVFRRFFTKMGFIRYMVLATLVLFMACLPIKMLLRWAFVLKYLVAIPEWFFNI